MENRPPKNADVPPPDADDDEYELELEAPDESIEQFRRQAIQRSVEHTIDIDEVYRESERDRGTEILENWTKNFALRFQFQIKHLLILTAIVAIALALARLHLFWTALIVLIMLSVASLYLFLKWEERKQQAEADRKREAMYAERRKRLAAQAAGNAPRASTPAKMPAVETSAPSPSEAVFSQPEPTAQEPFRFQFSLRQLIVVMTVASFVLGLMHILGGAAATATVLGLIALVGLFIFALGYMPPPIVVFGWWFTLVLYVVVSIVAALWNGLA